MTVIRKYVPLSVRVVVAERQFVARFPDKVGYAGGRTLRSRLSFLLGCLFEAAGVELHHRPALENRPLNRAKTDHVPPANDPEHLVYLLKDQEHKIETYVRGQNGQLSDAGLRRRNKRIEKRRAAKAAGTLRVGMRVTGGPFGKRGGRLVAVATSESRAKTRPPKRKWPSRPFPKGRKMRSR